MTRDDILRMALKADYATKPLPEFLERFARLVAAHEREQCAAVCTKQSLYYAEQDRQAESGAAGCCSVMIRSR